jgi:hypothetical protein
LDHDQQKEAQIFSVSTQIEWNHEWKENQNHKNEYLVVAETRSSEIEKELHHLIQNGIHTYVRCPLDPDPPHDFPVGGPPMRS